MESLRSLQALAALGVSESGSLEALTATGESEVAVSLEAPGISKPLGALEVAKSFAEIASLEGLEEFEVMGSLRVAGSMAALDALAALNALIALIVLGVLGWVVFAFNILVGPSSEPVNC